MISLFFMKAFFRPTSKCSIIRVPPQLHIQEVTGMVKAVTASLPHAVVCVSSRERRGKTKRATAAPEVSNSITRSEQRVHRHAAEEAKPSIRDRVMEHDWNAWCFERSRDFDTAVPRGLELTTMEARRRIARDDHGPSARRQHVDAFRRRDRVE